MNHWPDLLADPGSVRPIPGVDESVAACRCQIGGTDTVLIWNQFDVAAGTLSVASGQRFVEAIDVAIGDRTPVVAIANSGGARMQEGTAAFVQMIRTTAAVRRLRDAGLVYVVYLAHPTMGGVSASWASLGQVTFAEPGALIGFTGPRVAEALGEPIEPPERQRSESALEAGHVDALVDRDQLRSCLIDTLGVLAADSVPDSAPEVVSVRHTEDATAAPDGAPSGWAAVVASRAGGRRAPLEVVLERSAKSVPLHGDRWGTAADPAGHSVDGVRAELVRIGGRRLMLIGHSDRAARPTVAGLRLARRAMGLAEAWSIPVLAIIDTPGARISGEQERQGFAAEVARSMDTMLGLGVASVAIIAGQGSGGAAIAWMAADVVLATAESWVAPISPEAASLIVHRDTDHAAEMADAQQISAGELCAQGIVDRVGVDLDELIDEALVRFADRQGQGGELGRSRRAARFDQVIAAAQPSSAHQP